jgi:hypothetical protein
MGRRMNCTKRIAVSNCSHTFYRYSEHSKTWPAPPRTRSPRLKFTKSAACPGRTGQGSGLKTFSSGQKPVLQPTSGGFQMFSQGIHPLALGDSLSTNKTRV